jgi:hypothetical protein
VSEIDAHTLAVLGTRTIEGNPSALAITNDGDDDDLDETVYATQFFAELVPADRARASTRASRAPCGPARRRGAPAKITLAPFADVGFTADRRLFCRQFNVAAHSDIFCPDVGATSAAADVIAKDPQGAYPNQMASLVLRNGRAYLPSIGASPEPPVKFNVNVQALVNVVDVATNAELPDLHVNLNAQVKLEDRTRGGRGQHGAPVRQRPGRDRRHAGRPALPDRQPRRQLRVRGRARRHGQARPPRAPRPSATRRATSRPASWSRRTASAPMSTTRSTCP